MRTASSKFFNAQVSSISIDVLPRHACCVLSRLRCNRHSLLLSSYLTRIGRIENPSFIVCKRSSQDTSHLILHCPATDSFRRLLFGDYLSLRPLVQVLGCFPASGAPWSSATPPSLGRGWAINNNRLLIAENPGHFFLSQVALMLRLESIRTPRDMRSQTQLLESPT